MKSDPITEFLFDSAINTIAGTAAVVTMHAVAEVRGECDKTCFFSGLGVALTTFAAGHYIKSKILE